MTTGDPAFDPEPAGPADVVADLTRARAGALASFEMLAARLDSLQPAAREEAQALLAQREALLARLEACAAAADPTTKTRMHGDYHLGQVLVARNDFVIIDFEGEPARTFEERRAKGSPLRDVAGMLRSFSYAHWSALRRTAQSADELDKLAPLSQAWEAQVRPAFMSAYREGLGESSDDAGIALLHLFELEKALYELRYELGNRPDWVRVPLRGLAELLARPAPAR